VQRWLDSLGVTVADIHRHVRRLQQRFLAAGPHPELVPCPEVEDRGHFLTFRLSDAAAAHRALQGANIITDYRDDRLRIGFGLYHDDSDIDDLVRNLEAVPGLR
jgi:kynureninase